MTIALASGCSSATITLKNGRRLHGEIIRADDTAVFMLLDRGGAWEEVEHSRIREIDHPGNVLAGVSTPVALLSLAGTVSGVALMLSDDEGTRDTGGPIAVVFGAVALISTVAAFIGWTDWLRSRRAVSRRSTEDWRRWELAR